MHEINLMAWAMAIKKHLKFLYYEGLLHLNRCIV